MQDFIHLWQRKIQFSRELVINCRESSNNILIQGWKLLHDELTQVGWRQLLPQTEQSNRLKVAFSLQAEHGYRGHFPLIVRSDTYAEQRHPGGP